jgi:hypothetical protein
MLTFTATITALGDASCFPEHDGAVDANVACDGVEIGAVTLVPDADGYLATWGDSPDVWASSMLRRWLTDDEGALDPDGVIPDIVAAVDDALGAL